MSSTDPLGDDYWAGFEQAQQAHQVERAARDKLYGDTIPACGGWTNPWSTSTGPTEQPEPADADTD